MIQSQVKIDLNNDYIKNSNIFQKNTEENNNNKIEQSIIQEQNQENTNQVSQNLNQSFDSDMISEFIDQNNISQEKLSSQKKQMQIIGIKKGILGKDFVIFGRDNDIENYNNPQLKDQYKSVFIENLDEKQKEMLQKFQQDVENNIIQDIFVEQQNREDLQIQIEQDKLLCLVIASEEKKQQINQSNSKSKNKKLNDNSVSINISEDDDQNNEQDVIQVISPEQFIKNQKLEQFKIVQSQPNQQTQKNKNNLKLENQKLGQIVQKQEELQSKQHIKFQGDDLQIIQKSNNPRNPNFKMSEQQKQKFVDYRQFQGQENLQEEIQMQKQSSNLKRKKTNFIIDYREKNIQNENDIDDEEVQITKIVKPTKKVKCKQEEFKQVSPQDSEEEEIDIKKQRLVKKMEYRVRGRQERKLYGSFETDAPSHVSKHKMNIESYKQIKNQFQNESQTLKIQYQFYKVEFKQRPSGRKVLGCYYTYQELKRVCPRLLLEYLEKMSLLLR